jgi:hypothetical protein
VKHEDPHDFHPAHRNLVREPFTPLEGVEFAKVQEASAAGDADSTASAVENLERPFLSRRQAD